MITVEKDASAAGIEPPDRGRYPMAQRESSTQQQQEAKKANQRMSPPRRDFVLR